jgi:hypothetical protein
MQGLQHRRECSRTAKLVVRENRVAVYTRCPECNRASMVPVKPKTEQPV